MFLYVIVTEFEDLVVCFVLKVRHGGDVIFLLGRGSGPTIKPCWLDPHLGRVECELCELEVRAWIGDTELVLVSQFYNVGDWDSLAVFVELKHRRDEVEPNVIGH